MALSGFFGSFFGKITFSEIVFHIKLSSENFYSKLDPKTIFNPLYYKLTITLLVIICYYIWPI